MQFCLISAGLLLPAYMVQILISLKRGTIASHNPDLLLVYEYILSDAKFGFHTKETRNKCDLFY